MPTSRVLTYPILPLGARCDNAITYGQLASYGCLLLQRKQKKRNTQPKGSSRTLHTMERTEQTKKPQLIRSNTVSLGSLKRRGNTLHTTPSLSFPFHYHYHRRNHENARSSSSSPSRTKPATAPPWKESPIETPRREPVSLSLPASRKVSLQNDMIARRSSAPTRPQRRKSPIERECVRTPLWSRPNLYISGLIISQ